MADCYSMIYHSKIEPLHISTTPFFQTKQFEVLMNLLICHVAIPYNATESSSASSHVFLVSRRKFLLRLSLIHALHLFNLVCERLFEMPPSGPCSATPF